jgi:hypothetical protein
LASATTSAVGKKLDCYCWLSFFNSFILKVVEGESCFVWDYFTFNSVNYNSRTKIHIDYLHDFSLFNFIFALHEALQKFI